MRNFSRNETLCYFWIQFQSCQVAHLFRRIVAFICDCITTATGKKLKLGWFTLRMLTMNRPPPEDVRSCPTSIQYGRCGIDVNQTNCQINLGVSHFFPGKMDGEHLDTPQSPL